MQITKKVEETLSGHLVEGKIRFSTTNPKEADTCGIFVAGVAIELTLVELDLLRRNVGKLLTEIDPKAFSTDNVS